MNTNANSSTTSQWLAKATAVLNQAGVGTARLDALVLLADAVEHDKSWILAHPETMIDTSDLEKLNKQLKRRAKHEPLAYIRGKTEFYGREFYINKHVLEPRPESETMIELLKSHCAEDGPLRIIDVGTGSGTLAITAKQELPVARVMAIDIDELCLGVATINAQSHDVHIEFLHGNLLEPLFDQKLEGPVTILANLPYVPDDHALNQAAENEPRLAIFGGPDGLDLYRNMFGQLHDHFEKPVFVYTESLPFQHEELQNIAVAQGFTQTAEQDFIQVFERS